MRNSLIWIIKLTLTAAIIAVIASKLDVNSIVKTLLSASPIAVAAGLVIALVQTGLAAARLSAVVSIYDRVLNWRDAFRITLEGCFFSQTFVSFFGGDAQRIWRIRRCGLTLEDATSAIALDRLIGTIVNHAFLLVCLPWLLATITTSTIRIGLIVVALGGLGAISVALALGFMRGRTGLSARLPPRLLASRVTQLFRELATVGRHLFVPNSQLITAATLSFAMAALNCVIFYIILFTWQIPAGAAFGCALLVPAVMEIAMLPISIAGWGVREGTAILAFGSFGVPAEIAFGSSVTYALIVLAIALLGGATWLFDHREISAKSTSETLADADSIE
jgi:glycosyltransferase 2 family protein